MIIPDLDLINEKVCDAIAKCHPDKDVCNRVSRSARAEALQILQLVEDKIAPIHNLISLQLFHEDFINQLKQHITSRDT